MVLLIELYLLHDFQWLTILQGDSSDSSNWKLYDLINFKLCRIVKYLK